MGLINRAARVGKKFMNPVPTTVGDGFMMLKVLGLYLTNKEERTPKKVLGPFQTDPKFYRSVPDSGLRVTWMGHSTTLIEIDGMRVLVDPVWDERAAPVTWAGPKRFFVAPLRLVDLPRIDVVLISHDHYDHLGAETIKALSGSEAVRGAQFVTSLGVGAILERLGVSRDRITEMDWTDSLSIGALKITALPARHFSGRSLSNRFETLWSSFVLAGPKHRLYYGADSGEWAGFAEIGREYGPFDLTMLEIGAFNVLWADIHMGPDGAVRMFRALGGLGLMMPIHWGLFDLALHGWRQPIERIYEQAGLPVWSPTPGKPSEVVAGVELRSRWWDGSPF